MSEQGYAGPQATAAHKTSARTGQTGSGKTYTMGSAFGAGAANHGVIPNVMATLFELVRQVSPYICDLGNGGMSVFCGFRIESVRHGACVLP